MKHILEFFHDVIPIVFVVGIVALAFIFYNHTKNIATVGIEKTYAFSEQMEHSDILIYDQMTVTGADVVRFVRDFYKESGIKGAFPITISNINSGAVLTVGDVSDIVSGNARYRCNVTCDGGRPTGVAFTKK